MNILRAHEVSGQSFSIPDCLSLAAFPNWVLKRNRKYFCSSVPRLSSLDLCIWSLWPWTFRCCDLSVRCPMFATTYTTVTRLLLLSYWKCQSSAFLLHVVNQTVSFSLMILLSHGSSSCLLQVNYLCIIWKQKMKHLHYARGFSGNVLLDSMDEMLRWRTCKNPWKHHFPDVNQRWMMLVKTMTHGYMYFINDNTVDAVNSRGQTSWACICHATVTVSEAAFFFAATFISES